MIDFLFINIVYVSYRLIVSAHIVKFFNKYMPYSFAVLIMSQVSFAYDFGIFAYLFSAQSFPAIMEIVQANIKVATIIVPMGAIIVPCCADSMIC